VSSAPGAYIICATPRSGSTLLCDLLGQTGVAGRPHSYYRRESLPDFLAAFGMASDDGLDFERRYLAAAISAGTAGTGMFGLRLMWPSMADLQAQLARLFPHAAGDRERIGLAFGATLYVHLQRRDRVAQAVSRLKAEQSGLWHRDTEGGVRDGDEPRAAPVYDPEVIAAFVAETENHEAAWADWFDAAGIVPFELNYEELVADPREAIGRVLAALGRDRALAGRGVPQTAQLADAQSSAWADRFRREHRRSSGA